MTYDDYENSNQEGAPIFLYEFIRQTTTYRYASCDKDITIGGATYVRVAVKNSGFSKSGNVSTDTLQVEIDIDSAIARLFSLYPPSDSVTLRVRKLHRNPDTGEVTAAPVIWAGTVTGHQRKNSATRVLLCNTVFADLRRGSLRLTWQRNCPHMLYDGQCKVNKEMYRVNVASVNVIDGVRIGAPEIEAFENGYFDGGFIEWEIQAGVTERRGIEATEFPLLVIFGTTSGMSGGMSARIYPGCARTINVCNDKFNNVPNYGGIPHLPGRSPFDGNPVF